MFFYSNNGKISKCAKCYFHKKHLVLKKYAITFDVVQWDFFNEVITGNGMILLNWNFMFVG